MIHRIETKHIKLELKLPAAFGFRMRVCILLLRLAALVAPVTIEVTQA